MINLTQQPRILSIQSHVVSGYCGNKSATFPLQLLGFEVDSVNTVQLSNHTQYKVAKGAIFNKKDFEEIYYGLKYNKLTNFYTNIITGYMANVDYIESVHDAIMEIKESQKLKGNKCLYTFDPVLGDDGPGFYVPEAASVAKAYKKLMKLADIIVPNRFEASQLSGIEISSMPTALEAIDFFHEHGISLVVLTSFQLNLNKDELICIASYKRNTVIQRFRISIPKLNKQFTGTGDLFAALLTAWLNKTNFNIKESLEKTVRTIHCILEDTINWSDYHKETHKEPFSYELRLISNKHIIESGSTSPKDCHLEALSI